MIEKPISKIIQVLEAQSFSIIGNIGADGTGVGTRIINQSVISGARGDFIVSMGDISPVGRDPYYRNTITYLNRLLKKPMYLVPGENDGPQFEEYFGPRNKAIISEQFTLIMLDNSQRRFTDEALAFLREMLAITQSHNIIVAFYFPPPNRFFGDSLTRAEWSRFEEAAGVWRKRISLLMASRCRSYFEDDIDGLHLITTGGGGGSITGTLDRIAQPPHHLIEFSVNDQACLQAEFIPAEITVNKDRAPEVVRLLQEYLEVESAAHTYSTLDAIEAEKQGKYNLARMFRAIAESSLHQVSDIRRLLQGPLGSLEAIDRALADQKRPEIDKQAGQIEPSEDGRDALAVQSLHNGVALSIVNNELFSNARSLLAAGERDIESAGFYVCDSCGIVFSGSGVPENCSECGAPFELIREVD